MIPLSIALSLAALLAWDFGRRYLNKRDVLSSELQTFSARLDEVSARLTDPEEKLAANIARNNAALTEFLVQIREVVRFTQDKRTEAEQKHIASAFSNSRGSGR